jgi:asparagine N-glycosylation enzyme membrane subunit Stt3
MFNTPLLSKKQGFKDRMFVITYLGFSTTFVVGFWIVTFISWILEKNKIILKPLGVYILISLVLILSIFYTLLSIRPKVKNYFKNNFPSLIKKEDK